MADRVGQGMTPLEVGRRRYQKKEYVGALEAFTKAVNMSSDHMLLTALDSRAGTYEKLNRLQQGLRDAKAMIELLPKSSKGYLRCGKILQLKGEKALALKIYERGLTKVKISDNDQQRSLLQSMYNKLRQEQNPGKSRDPLEYLPVELAVMVCQQMDMRDRVICLAVSRAWKKLLDRCHGLWTTMDTTHAKKAVSLNSMKAHLKRSNYTMDRAIITMRSYIPTDASKSMYLLQKCKKLRELQIKGSGVIGESLTKAIPGAKSLDTISVSPSIGITLSAVHLILATCTLTLINATFLNITGNGMAKSWAKLENLKRISLRSENDILLNIESLRDSTPNVEYVSLNRWTFATDRPDLTAWTRLQHLDLTNTKLRLIPVLPPSIRHLILDNNRFGLLFASTDPIPELPLLETLSIQDTFISGAILSELAAQSIKNGNLKKLCVGERLVDLIYTPVEEEFPASETLEELDASSLIINDNQAISIVGQYPNLTKLNMSSTRITGVAVRHFVNVGIRQLNLDECESIGTDAIEWARGKGVGISFTFRSAMGRGGFVDRVSRHL